MPQQIRIPNHIIKCDFFTVYCDLACKDRLLEIVFRICLKLFGQNFEDIFAQPSFLCMSLEYVRVWLDEAEGIFEYVGWFFCWVELHLYAHKLIYNINRLVSNFFSNLIRILKIHMNNIKSTNPRIFLPHFRQHKHRIFNFLMTM